MSDAVLIALLALVGSALGGLLAPVLIRFLDRSATKSDRAHTEDAARHEALGDAIQGLVRSGVRFASLRSDASLEDYDAAALETIVAMTTLELLFKPEDEPMVEAMRSQMKIVLLRESTADERLRALGRVSHALANWRRDPVDVEAHANALGGA